jgi:hypothetical protein
MPGKHRRYRGEKLHGWAEAPRGFEQLRSLWPAAFPKENDLVRPLTRGIIRTIADGTGWSPAYAQGVLSAWKQRVAYCKAVLAFDRRWNLNGEKTDEAISDEAREMARTKLARVIARQEAKARASETVAAQ